MRTIQTTVCSFNELNEAARETAIEHFRSTEDYSFIYDEAHETVNKFHEMFDTKEGRKSWLDVYTDHIDDNLLQLKGLRLRTYLLNNYKLWKPKFIKSFDHHLPAHRMIRNKTAKTTGAKYCFAYSNIKFENSCVLTGVCYDDDILEPIYKFIEAPQEHVNFEMLLNDCFENLEKAIENEIECRNSDIEIIETIEANDYEFTEGGELI